MFDTSPDAGFVEGAHNTSPAAEAFVAEQLGIASNWYVYDGATHALSPEPVRYQVRSLAFAAELEIITYYNERGESGFFTFRVRVASPDASGWGASTTVRLETSVKEQPVCVDLRSPAVVDCTAPHDMVARTDRRVVPAAGFAVVEPAIYVVARQGEPAPEVRSLPSDTVVAPDAATTGTLVLDALAAPANSVLGPVPALLETASVLHATTDMFLAQWHIVDVSQTDDATVAHLRVRCVPLATAPIAQEPLHSIEPVSVELTIPPTEANEWVRIDLCNSEGGPRVLESTATAALWPAGELFDLLAATRDGSLVWIAGPGSLVHVPANDAGGELPAVTPPASLWN